MLLSLELSPAEFETCSAATVLPADLLPFRLHQVRSKVRGLLLAMLYILTKERDYGDTAILLTSPELTEQHVDWLKRASKFSSILAYRPLPEATLEELHYSTGKRVLLSTIYLSEDNIKRIQAVKAYTITQNSSKVGKPSKGSTMGKCIAIPYVPEVFVEIISDEGIHTYPTPDMVSNAVSKRRALLLSNTTLSGVADPSELSVLSFISNELRVQLDAITDDATHPQAVSSQSEIVYNLGVYCLYRKILMVREMLCHQSFSVRDDMYSHPLSSTLERPGIQLNDSAFILCCAVAGGSTAIIELLLHETAPGCTIDPAAMDNLALRAAITRGEDFSVQILGSDPRVVCSPAYYIPRKYRLDEVLLSPTLKNLSKKEIASILDERALAVYNLSTFRKFYRQKEATLKALALDSQILDLVRDTHLHRALLFTFQVLQELEDPEALVNSKTVAEVLCLASCMRERMLKYTWFQSSTDT